MLALWKCACSSLSGGYPMIGLVFVFVDLGAGMTFDLRFSYLTMFATQLISRERIIQNKIAWTILLVITIRKDPKFI
jgi:hypothetical protein